MQTQVLPVHPETPEAEVIGRAAAVLRAGRLVAFPTETVYGLGATALDAAAVGRIFEAKGRPANNPVIVHVARPEEAAALVADWPEAAERLAAQFWPGPLTLVLARNERVPSVVTAGGPTVAVRMPAHPVARALIEAAGVPVAAPSANRSMRLSPTRAEHVLRDLGGRIDLLLDGGPTPGGLESTVLDVTKTIPRLLRPGLVTPDEIEGVIGPIERRHIAAADTDQPLPSPGLLSRHYAPRSPLECVSGDGTERVEALARAGLAVGWLFYPASRGRKHPEAPAASRICPILMPPDPTGYASRLYAVLHSLDDAGVDRIVVELPPDRPEWLAVHDRLRRASTAP